jgi:hypothetical protein
MIGDARVDVRARPHLGLDPHAQAGRREGLDALDLGTSITCPDGIAVAR